MAKATQFWGRMRGFVTKKANETSPHLTPVKRENIPNPQIGRSANKPLNLVKSSTPAHRRTRPAGLNRAASTWESSQCEFDLTSSRPAETVAGQGQQKSSNG